jgi:hypothetical protein
MNHAIKEALLKQKIRRSIRGSLKTSVISEEATLYSTFVQPFSDVLTAVNLGAQEILNSTFTLFRLMFTFDPEKGRERLKAHDDRKAKIAKKWQPLMDRVDADLSTGDADIIALTFAPGVFALSSLGGKSYEAAEGIGTFLTNTGLKIPLIGTILPGYDDTIEVKQDDKVGSLLDKLELLFLGVVAAEATSAAVKKMEKKEFDTRRKKIILESADSDFISDFNEYLDDTGVLDELNQTRDELIESLKETVKQFDDDFEARKKILDDIAAAASLSEFQIAIQPLDNLEGVDSSKINSGKIQQELDKAMKELMSNDEFKKKASEELKNQDMSDKDFQELASKVVFADAKQGLIEKIEEGMESLKKDIGEYLEKVLPSDGALITIKKSKAGIKFADFVENTKRKYKIS